MQCGTSLRFSALDPIFVKGKSEKVNIYRPYPSDPDCYPLPSPAHHGGKNLFTPIYTSQREYFAAQQSLIFLQAFLRRNAQREQALFNSKSRNRFPVRGEDTSSIATKPSTSSTNGSGNNNNNKKSSKQMKSSLSFARGYSSNGDDNRSSDAASTASHVSAGRRMSAKRNSIITLKPEDSNSNSFSQAQSQAQTTPTISTTSRKTKTHRPTLTPAGIKPIHRSDTFDFFERKSSFGRMSDFETSGNPFNSPGRTPTPNNTPTNNNSNNNNNNNNENFPNENQNENKIFITVPRQLRIDNLRIDSPMLQPVNMSDVKTFYGLLSHAKKLAAEANLLTPEQLKLGTDAFCLNISGTRSFLPTSNFDIKFLPAFIACAFDVDLGDDEIDEMLIDFSSFDVYTNSPRRKSLLKSQSSFQQGNIFELTFIAEMEMLNVQSRLCVARRTLLEQKLQLVDKGIGSITILEGEPGSGKTEILASFVARCLPNTAVVYVTSGSPFFGHATNCGPWATVIQQYLDLTAKASINEPNSTTSTNNQDDDIQITRANTLMDELKKSGCSSELLDEAYIMNDLLKIKIPLPEGKNDARKNSNSSSNNVAHFDNEVDGKKNFVREIIMKLLHRLSSYRPSLIIMDNAMYLDDFSWELAYEVANDVDLALTIVFATRPIGNYQCRYSKISSFYEQVSERCEPKKQKLPNFN